MTHTLKIKESFADAIATGDKTFEVRENDKGFQKGDYVTFNVIGTIDNLSLSIDHMITDRVYEITYVLSGWGIQEGYVVFGIREPKRCEGVINNDES